MSSSKIEKILESHDLISDKSTYRSILTKGKKVAIFGAGQNYWAFKFFVLKKFDIDIDLVIDDKFDHLEFFDGIKVTSSSSKLINELKKDEYIIIITLGVTSKHQKIKKKLRNIGFKNIVTAYDFYEYHLAYASKEITYAGIKYYRKHSENIHTAYSMLQDDLSKEVYSQILDTYVTRRLKPINSRSFDEQYIPKDISLSKGHQSMINCGSFDGDTLKRLIKKGVKFKNIICIEPNLKNFIELTNWIDKEKKIILNLQKILLLYHYVLEKKFRI